MEATIIFPHQLYKQHPALKKGRVVYLVEEWLFFEQYRFHKQKLILHRASMKCFEALLTRNGYTVNYVESGDNSDIRVLVPALKKKKITALHFTDPTDDWLKRRLYSACKKAGIECKEYTSPNFLNSMEEANAYFDGRKTYFQTDFYIAERKKRNILIEGNNKPVGGKWSFDAENRKKYPAKKIAPALPALSETDILKEAIQYVETKFSDNIGSSSPPFNNTYYPVTHKQALQWFTSFIEERFTGFGEYEDAIVAHEKILHHSVMSASLNIGSIQPHEVLQITIEQATKLNIPLNSVEGFVRQVMGWREYIRIVYEREGRKQRTKNFWGFHRKIPYSFWEGTTGIEPVDAVIKKLLETGYSHHIERLMVMGNFFLLCEFDPDEVYRWFMEMYIDAYDWVMVPNTYGMTQFADGGLMMTKPYISSSNYILKMSDHKKGNWCNIWDGLFWRFMHVHRDLFEKNPRLSFLFKTLDKMSKEKLNEHLAHAENFLAALDHAS